MLRISISEAHPGMVLARMIPNPQQPEQALLKAGFELQSETIDRLVALKVPGAWIRYPSLDFLDEVIDPEVVKKQQDLYGSMKNEFQESQEMNFSNLNYRQYLEQLKELFQLFLNTSMPSSHFIADMFSESQDIFMHGTMTASLAMLLGMRIEAYIVKNRGQLPNHMASDITALGLGCLLHDLGKLNLPEELRTFHLTAQDMGTPQWQSHTEAGFEMMKGGLDPTSGQIVINHHQHYDGSGFPYRRFKPGENHPSQPLAGDNIHIFCRIAAIVDRFDGFRYMPDGRQAPTIVALKRLKNQGYAKWFDPYIYKTFLKSTPAFSLGEMLTLNTGQQAVVVQVNENDPCRPIVRPIDLKNADKDKDPQEAPDIDLSQRQELHVAKVGNFDVTPFLH